MVRDPRISRNVGTQAGVVRRLVELDRTLNQGGVSQTRTLQPGAVTGTYIGQNSITTGHIQSGSITTGTLAAGAVTAGTIAAGAIQTVHLTAGSVTTGALAAGSVTTFALAAGAVTAGVLASGSITTDKLAAGSITTDKLQANSITAGVIAAGAITTRELAANSVTTGTLAAGSVTTRTLAAGAVTAGNVAAGAVTTVALAAGSVTTTAIAANAVTAATIDANAINGMTVVGAIIKTSNSAPRIQIDPLGMRSYRADGSVNFQFDSTSGDLSVSGTITANNSSIVPALAVGADGSQLVTNQLKDLAITTGKLALKAVTADQIATNTITADQMAANSITTAALSVATGGGNLYANQNINFETNATTGWTGSNATLSITTSEIKYGSYGLLASVVADGTWAANLLGSPVSLTTGSGQYALAGSYNLSYWIRGSRGNGQAVRVVARCFDSSGTLLGDINLPLNNSEAAGTVNFPGPSSVHTWYRPNATFTLAQLRATYSTTASIGLRVIGTGASAGDSYVIDAIMLQEGDLPGAFTAFGPGQATSIQIADGAIVASKLTITSLNADGTIANNAVGAAALNVPAINGTTGNLATNAVNLTTQIADGVITTAKVVAAGLDAGVIKSGFIASARIQAGTIDATKLAIQPGGNNLLRDSSLEDNVRLFQGLDWKLSDNALLQLEPGGIQPIGGQRGVAYCTTAPATNGNAYIYQDVTSPLAGATVTASAWIYVRSGATLQGTYRTLMVTSNGTVTSANYGTTPNGSFDYNQSFPTNSWQRISVKYTIPSDATYVRVRLYCPNTTRATENGAGEIIFDSVKLEYGDTPTGWGPGIDGTIIDGDTINSGYINGSVITGATIRTAASGVRTQVDATGAAMYNDTGILATNAQQILKWNDITPAAFIAGVGATHYIPVSGPSATYLKSAVYGAGADRAVNIMSAQPGSGAATSMLSGTPDNIFSGVVVVGNATTNTTTLRSSNPNAVANYASVVVQGDTSNSRTVNITAPNGLFINGTQYTGSDERLKTNIKTISNQLDVVNALQPKSFTKYNAVTDGEGSFKADRTKNAGDPTMGFIAQEVEAVLPTLVMTDPELGYKTLDSGTGLVAVLWQAVRELSAKVDKLEATTA